MASLTRTIILSFTASRTWNVLPFTDTILVITNDRAYVKLRLGSLQFTDSSWRLVTRDQTKLHFPLFVCKYCNFLYLLAIRKNTVCKLMWWLYKYATIPYIVMTWLVLHTSYMWNIYKILLSLCKWNLKLKWQINTKHNFGIVVSNSYILISKTRLFLVNTAAFPVGRSICIRTNLTFGMWIVHVIAVKARCVTTNFEWRYKAVHHSSVKRSTFLITQIRRYIERCYKINITYYRLPIFFCLWDTFCEAKIWEPNDCFSN